MKFIKKGSILSTRIRSAMNLLILLLGFLNFGCDSSSRKDYPITPVSFNKVKVHDSFWSPRLETNKDVSIPHAFHQCEVTGRIDNFAKAARLMEGEFEGLRFNDSDVYKVIEGASYSLAVHPDPELDRYLDNLIAKIAAAQERDGYLFTALTINPENPPKGVSTKRWVSERTSHELYCAGHLYEAAVAHYLATGKKTLLVVALKNADLIDKVFGPDKLRVPPGHQEIEISLIKLYRLTGNERYLKLAKFFLEERGQTREHESYGEYFQDHKPIFDQEEAVGHAVRAAYMYSAMADMAALTGDQRYIKVLDKIWKNVASKKIYITGGIGGGNGEGFSVNYDLPNMRAYNETCASIANALWNYRMFLLKGNAKYIDLLERIIYNSFLSGIGLSGDLFFYSNRLATIEGEKRRPWFNCACCPSNVVRFMPQIPGFIYARKKNNVYINLFIGSDTILNINGKKVKVSIDTAYPWAGRVIVKVEPEVETEFALQIRIPGWVKDEPLPGGLYKFLSSNEEDVMLYLNGEMKSFRMEKGFANLKRKWHAGDKVELKLPLQIKRVQADEHVIFNRGRVALCRGPLIYCLEWPDNPNGVYHLVLPDSSVLQAEFRNDLLSGMTIIKGKALSTQYSGNGQSVIVEKEEQFTAIPYYAWAHRASGPMVVWIARQKEAAWPLPEENVAFSSRITSSIPGLPGTTLKALNDQIIPKGSNDKEIPRFAWQTKGTLEWVQYGFSKSAKISEIEVYWFEDKNGVIRAPQSWRLLYRKGNRWIPVSSPSGYKTGKDCFNVASFEPITTDALRLEVQLQPGKSSGILEWRVK